MRLVLLLLFLMFVLVFPNVTAQESSTDKWQHWLVIGNKVVFGGQTNWQNSHELQTRIKGNMDELDSYFYEGIFTYSPNSHWEIAPDYRFTRKTGEIEFRPGFGVIYKSYFGKNAEGRPNS